MANSFWDRLSFRRGSGRRQTSTRQSKRAGRRLRIEALEERWLPSAVVATDQQEYAPGDTATITGSGYGANETVNLNIALANGNPGTNRSVADDANGNFTTTVAIPSDGSWASPAANPLTLTATGQTSHQSAQTTFTDPSVTFNGTGVDAMSGFTNSARVTFSLSGSGSSQTLTVTLLNTATQVYDASHQMQPTDVLSGVLFDIAGNPNLTVGNANLASGSHMVNPPPPGYTAGTDFSASGWGFAQGTANINPTTSGQNYGIEAFGGISTPSGSGSFANSNTPPNIAAKLDGIDWGIADSFYTPGTATAVSAASPSRRARRRLPAARCSSSRSRAPSRWARFRT